MSQKIEYYSWLQQLRPRLPFLARKPGLLRRKSFTASLARLMVGHRTGRWSWTQPLRICNPADSSSSAVVLPRGSRINLKIRDNRMCC